MDVNPISVCQFLQEIAKREFPTFEDKEPTDCEKVIAEELIKKLKEYMRDFEIDEDQELIQGKNAGYLFVVFS